MNTEQDQDDRSWKCCERVIRSAFCPACGIKKPTPKPVQTSNIEEQIEHGLKILKRLSRSIQSSTNAATTYTNKAQKWENDAVIAKTVPESELQQLHPEWFRNRYNDQMPEDVRSAVIESILWHATSAISNAKSRRATVLKDEADAACLCALLNAIRPGITKHIFE